MKYDDDIKALLEQADDYALRACEEMEEKEPWVLPREENFEGFSDFEQAEYDFMEKLKIGFLFPELQAHEAALLRGIQIGQEGLNLSTGFAPAWGCKANEKHAHEMEQFFMETKKKFIEAGAMERLSQAQRRLLEQCYFQIHFHDGPPMQWGS